MVCDEFAAENSPDSRQAATRSCENLLRRDVIFFCVLFDSLSRDALNAGSSVIIFLSASAIFFSLKFSVTEHFS